MPRRPPSALAALRTQGGADAVRAALVAALAAHPTRAGAARALGIAPANLRRVAASVGVELARRPAGRPRRGAPDAVRAGDEDARLIRADDAAWEARRATATWHGGLTPEAHAAITAAHVDATLQAVDVRRLHGVAVRMRPRRERDGSIGWAPGDEGRQ